MSRARTLANLGGVTSSATELNLLDGQTDLASQAELDAIPEYDDVGIRQDITTLALREATNESSVAFNLPSSFIDTFTDSTNLGTLIDTTRYTGYVSSTTLTPTEYDYNAADTDHNLVIWTGMSSGNDAWREIDTDGHTGYDATKFIIPAIGISGNYYTNYAPNSTGDGVYFKFDFGESRTFSGKLKIGKHTPSGNVSQYKLLYSTNDSSYSAWNMSGISQLGSTVYGVGSGGSSGGNVTSGTAAGILNLADQGTNITSVSTIQGVPTITARYIKISVNAMGSGNNNAGVMQFAPFEGEDAIEATGTVPQNTNTVTGTKTKVAGVMLYKDNGSVASTFGSGNDLEILFCCNGSDYTTVASYTAVTPEFSGDIKMVKLGETTCTNVDGTSDIRYKAVWANQVISSKETQLHGIGLNY